MPSSRRLPMEKWTMFARSGTAESDLLRNWSALGAGAINLRIVPCPLQMPDISLRSIEPLIVIVLEWMCRKGAEADEVRR